MLFWTKKAQNEWENQSPFLLDYYSKIQKLDFCNSSALLEKLIEKHRLRWEALTDSDPDIIYNDYYLFGILLDLLNNYSVFWDLVTKEKFGESWSSLQDVQDCLRVLRKFGRTMSVHLLDVIEEQCFYLEELYPYKLFMSMEATYDEVECSICGKDMNSLECPHIKGELYRGKHAVGIINHLQQLHALSLVSIPCDKRCVVIFDDNAWQFKLIRYLCSIIWSGQISPFGFVCVEKKRIEVPSAELSNLSRNDPCPCGSNLKFKKCCLGKPRIERDHFDLVGTHRSIISASHLVNLSADAVALPDGMRL